MLLKGKPTSATNYIISRGTANLSGIRQIGETLRILAGLQLFGSPKDLICVDGLREITPEGAVPLGVLQSVGVEFVRRLVQLQKDDNMEIEQYNATDIITKIAQKVKSVESQFGKGVPHVRFVIVTDSNFGLSLSDPALEEFVALAHRTTIEVKLVSSVDLKNGAQHLSQMDQEDISDDHLRATIKSIIENVQDVKPAKKAPAKSKSKLAKSSTQTCVESPEPAPSLFSGTTSSTRPTAGRRAEDPLEIHLDKSETSTLAEEIPSVKPSSQTAHLSTLFRILDEFIEESRAKSGKKHNIRFDPFSESELPEVYDKYAETSRTKPTEILQTISARKAIREYFSSPFSVVDVKDLNLGLKKYFSLLVSKLGQDGSCRYKFQGWLEVHPELKLEVLSTTASQLFQGFHMKKASKVPETLGDIKAERLYYQADTRDFISPENLKKGIEFGRKFIPLPDDADTQKRFVDEQKQIKLLCFTLQKNLPRHMLLGGIDTIYASGDTKNKIAFNAIVEALLESQKVGIVRYTIKSNTPPRLCGLIPMKKQDGMRLFYLSALPTAENIRDYRYSSLVPCTSSQETLVAQLVEKMDLTLPLQTDSGEIRQIFEPHTLVSPDAVMYHQNLLNRATLDPRSLNSTMDEEMEETYMPERHVHSLAASLAEQVRNAFQFVEHDIEKSVARARVFWNYLHAQELQREANATLALQQAALEKSKLGGPDGEGGGPRSAPPAEISPITPVTDFMALVNNRAADHLPFALDSMTRIITNLISACPASDPSKPIDCLQAMRDVCIREDEVECFNRLLRQIATTAPKRFLQALLQRNIGLIRARESPVGGVPDTEADTFTRNMEQAAGITHMSMDLEDIE